MQRTFFLLIGFFISINAFTQKHDYHWMMGYGSDQDTILGNYFGTSRINFNYDPPTVYLEDTDLNFDVANVSICDEEGQLLFYSNGIEIHNVADEPMLNSEDFNYSEYIEYWEWEEGGLRVIQGLMSIPSASDENLYYLFHCNFEAEIVSPQDWFYYNHLYYTSIDMAGDSGKGVVIEKGVPFVEDTLAVGGLTAIRHANGRDWWILMQERNRNRFYRVLLDPDGVHLKESQELGSFAQTDGITHSVFSPDGTWYIRHEAYNEDGNNYLNLYRFDRCTGLLSNHQRFAYGDGQTPGGIAISPDNRFLYVVHVHDIHQLDLEADDILSSIDTIGIYDGFLEGDFLPTRFFSAQSTPDGKIYLTSSFSISYLHVIHNPNGQGAECQFEQRGIDLPTFNAFSLPNFPNYRLGPIDGSPCDTLSIDNLPLAAFNYYADSSDYLSINFWDYSYYEPTDWEWTFGDGSTGSSQTPTHTYAGNGVYQVCLTASNEYGSDTLCKWLQLFTTGVKEILPEQGKLLIYPNPSNGIFTVALPDKEVVPAKVTLFNLDGRKVQEFAGTNPIQIDGSRLPQGIYTIKVLLESGSILTERIVIVR